jgi:hypothetical protein
MLQWKKARNMSTQLEDVKINVKLKISALWVAMLFVFAYVDIFAFFRSDILRGVMAGKVASFDINQMFLLLTTIYIVIPSVMVFLTLVMKPKVNRWANIVLAVIYFATIIAGCVGETWGYYLFGSAVECVLLLLIIWYAWKWPKMTESSKVTKSIKN